MKFDLHIHTERDKWINEDWFKDETKRYELFKEKLIKHEILYAGITNHYKFNEDDFNSLNKLLKDEKILLIPGIECDVKISEDTIRQFTINTMDKKFLKDFSHEKGNPIGIIKFNEMLNSTTKQIILGIHFLKQVDKDPKKSRGFSDIKEVNEATKGIDNNLIVKILDLPSSDRKEKANKHISNEYLSFTFSDVQNWKEYDNDAKDLPVLSDYHKKISFDYFWDLLNNDMFQTKQKDFLEIKNKYSNENFGLSLYNGLNIVFGNKGTGKTVLLNDFYEYNENDFTFINFKQLEYKSIKNFYEQLKKDNLIEKDAIIKFNKNIKLLDTKVNFSDVIKVKIEWKLKEIIKNIEININDDILKKLKKGIFFFNKIHVDYSKKNELTLEINKNIDYKLFCILDEISNKYYKGKITKNSIICLIKKNINDWKKNIKLNYYKLKQESSKELSNIFKSSSDIKIGINEKIIEIRKNFHNKIEVYKKWMEIENKIQRSNLLFENKIKNDKINNNFSFSWNVIPKTKDNKINVDLLMKRGQGINIKKIPDNNKTLNDFLETMKTNKLQKIKNHNFDHKDSEISHQNFKIIYFKSKNNDLENYIPSSGEYDIMKINNLLQQNKNLIIDEFCNTLDSEFIYHELIPKLKNYKGYILASTHNPIISTIAYVQKYIYKTREKNEFNMYQSDNSIYGNFVDIKISVKEQILKTIEGSEEAFKKRGEKYGITT